jgi:GTP-binding protein YchF
VFLAASHETDCILAVAHYRLRREYLKNLLDAMKIGLVGFAGSGKTTFFNALTGKNAPTGDFGSQKVHLGSVRVPDSRVDVLGEIYDSRKLTYAEIACVDVPGRAGTPGQGIDSATLDNIRDVSALALVLGAFQPDTDPAKLASAYRSELLLTDLMLVEKRLAAASKNNDKEREKKLLEMLLAHLEDDQPLVEFPEEELAAPELRQYAFVSDKPIIAVINVDEATLELGDVDQLAESVEARGIPAFVLSGRLEAELADLEPEEQAEFLEALGLEETARDRFIHAAYRALDLITFLTGGESESRAWPIRKGLNAKQAAGKIHTDLEHGFIRAEVFHYEEIVEVGSEAELKALGRMRLEGKDYIVADGDVMLIRHS